MGGVPSPSGNWSVEASNITGAMFAGRTVTENVMLFDFAPVSIAQIVIAEEPACAPAVTVTLRAGGAAVEHNIRRRNNA